MTNITNLSNTDARAFFMKAENYCTIELPEYFSFQKVLDDSADILHGSDINSFYNHDKDRPYKHNDTCYTFYINKGFEYGWRPISIIHPLLYVNLINEITKEDNWSTITNFFSDYENNNIVECYSIPIKSDDDNISDKAAMINQWSKNIEQKSIELALEYSHLLQTDIKNCYGSLYTHAIAWALHGKPDMKVDNSKSFLGNKIDGLIRDMTFGQTNGIPQGSVIMDLIAEIVIAYIDDDLNKKIREKEIEGFKIIRYRDDYRIFTNDPIKAANIVKLLSESLQDIGMSLNEHKTILSNNIIRDSLKPAKLAWLKEKRVFTNVKNNLMFIHSFSEMYPSSGTLITELNKFHQRLEDDFNGEISDEYLRNKDIDYIRALCSIVSDIAYRNPNIFPQATAIMSTLLTLVEDKESKNKIIESILLKLLKLPNTGMIQVWMQRLVLKLDFEYNFEERLCIITEERNNPQTTVWNSSWLNDKTKEQIDTCSIIDSEIIEKMAISIENEEIKLFESIY